MLLTTLLLSTVSANAASAGCFNGGAFVGAQAGFIHAMLKQEANAKPISKDDADKKVTKLVAAVAAASFAADKAAFTKATAADTYQVSVDLSDIKKSVAADKTTAEQRFVDALTKALGDSSFKTAQNINVVVLNSASATPGDAFVIADLQDAKVVKDFLTADNQKAYSAKLVDADAEKKYSSNNGFAGIHAGYLGRVNDKFLVGGLVEGNWVFGQDMKKDGDAQKDVNARFNVNLFLRALFNMTEKFMVGADIGFSGQEIRQLKAGTTVATGTKAKSSDKESKWFWNPAARLVLGVALTENILATAHFGGVFPMMKQDSLDKSVKAKYSNFHGGVGISYAFGG